MKKVFICWSGDRAKHVATGLFKWLPDVLQNVDPWMSEESVAAGARFNREVEGRLDATDFGILCITPENQTAPWIHYEAGALGKNVDVSRVVPYLIGMKSKTEVVEGPLTRFQAKFALTETLVVLKSLNDVMGAEGLATERLERAYEKYWPDLKKVIESAPEPARAQPLPDIPTMVREILETVRGMASESSRSVPLSSNLGGEIRDPAFMGQVADFLTKVNSSLILLDLVRVTPASWRARVTDPKQQYKFVVRSRAESPAPLDLAHLIGQVYLQHTVKNRQSLVETGLPLETEGDDDDA